MRPGWLGPRCGRMRRRPGRAGALLLPGLKLLLLALLYLGPLLHRRRLSHQGMSVLRRRRTRHTGCHARRLRTIRLGLILRTGVYRALRVALRFHPGRLRPSGSFGANAGAALLNRRRHASGNHLAILHGRRRPDAGDATCAHHALPDGLHGNVSRYRRVGDGLGVDMNDVRLHRPGVGKSIV